MSNVRMCLTMCWAMSTVAILVTDARAARALIDLEHAFDLAAVKTYDAHVTLTDRSLQINTGHQYDWPGIVLAAPGHHWDLSSFGYVAVDVRNLAGHPVAIICGLDSPGADGGRFCVTHSVELAPHGRGELKVPMPVRLPKRFYPVLFGMRGLPGGVSATAVDPAKVTRLRVFVDHPANDHCFQVGNIRADGVPPPSPTLPDKLFPLIDSFGQYRHNDWPGKTGSLEDFALHRKEEAVDLAAHPGPDDWDQYGGWKMGPQLPATSFFRAQKHEGKWWLVDPEGRLFWSHGINGVRSRDGTAPITDRKHWFADLPAPDSAFGRYYSTSNYAPHNYYEGRTYETYNFTAANLLRKYGDDWPQEFGLLCHRRLRSWGLNTVANWSDPAIYVMRQTPYTATFNVIGKPLAGSKGYWRKFSDVFDPAFLAAARNQMAKQKDRSVGDPWCIGYFVDNELTWGDITSLAIATLCSPSEQPAKQAFLDDLKRKYKTIERLNATWCTRYASWDGLRQSTTPPRDQGAREDLEVFSTRMAERYFEICRMVIKEAAPNQLYLGCRFTATDAWPIRAAGKYCDAVSFNWYKHSAADLQLPATVDKPIMISEFHFGALDRGLFHPGLVSTANQVERAEAYRAYIHSALRNPRIVGAHWFQFGDQPTTGRGDGENYQIGFLDVCDTPYVETIKASRDVAHNMYRYRAGT